MQTQTFNISMPKDLVSRIDIMARKQYRNRSEFLKEAARKYLEDILEWEEIFDYGLKIGKKMGIKSEDDVNRIVQEYRHGKKN